MAYEASLIKFFFAFPDRTVGTNQNSNDSENWITHISGNGFKIFLPQGK